MCRVRLRATAYAASAFNARDVMVVALVVATCTSPLSIQSHMWWVAGLVAPPHVRLFRTPAAVSHHPQ
jgi:hypothetical protein